MAFGEIWPAALATALLWEGTRRALAIYLGQNNMISGYGPIGAAMALLFWLYVANVILLLGAELAYSLAKERRGLRPDQQLRVLAPPGEQPTPKFAPQVGAGIHIDEYDEHEGASGADGAAARRTARLRLVAAAPDEDADR